MDVSKFFEMWLFVLPLLLVVGVATPVLISRRNYRVKNGQCAYKRVEGSDPFDLESPECELLPLETTVCDVTEWLENARDRLNITSTPVIEKVPISPGVFATRVTFETKNEKREIWLDGPDFMKPLPRLRSVEWKQSDSGIAFVRNQDGIEKAVFESFAKRE